MTQTQCWSTTIAHIFYFCVAQEVGNGIVAARIHRIYKR